MKKNFRDLKVAPKPAIVKCIGGCGAKILKSEVENCRWYVINEKFYCCPHCDVTIINETQKNKK